MPKLKSSMSNRNKLFSHWLSQIRKIWGQTGDQNHLDFLKRLNNNAFKIFADRIICKSNNIVCITQRVGKIDNRFREMAHVYIQCQKKIINKKVLIFQNYYFGDDNISAIEAMEYGQRPKTTYFIGNQYFPYYSSYELISRGGDYL